MEGPFMRLACFAASGIRSWLLAIYAPRIEFGEAVDV